MTPAGSVRTDRRLTHSQTSTLNQGDSLCAQAFLQLLSKAKTLPLIVFILLVKIAQEHHHGAHKKQHVTEKNPTGSGVLERFPTLSPSEPEQPIETTISASLAPKT